MKVKLTVLALILALLLCGCKGQDAGEGIPNLTLPGVLLDAISEAMGIETTEPESSAPEITLPLITAPPTTEPETTVPETTIPETTEPETTVPETTVPETTVPETTVPETTVPETTVPPTTAPEPTTAPTEPEEVYHGYECGLLVQVGDVVYAAEPDRISRWEGGTSTTLCKPGWSEPSNICVDDYNLLYIGPDNSLMYVELATGDLYRMTDPFDHPAYLEGAVGGTCIINLWPEDAWCPETYFMDLLTGEMQLSTPQDVTCRNGYLIFRDYATDVSPRMTWICDAEGELILDEVMTWNVGFNNGLLWYTESNVDYDAGKLFDDTLVIRAWKNGRWKTIVNEPIKEEWTSGGAYVDDAYILYNGEYRARSVANGEYVDSERNQFLRNVQEVVTVGGRKYYREGANIWRLRSSGELKLLATLEDDGPYYPVRITDSIYAYTPSGVKVFKLS